MHVVILKRVNQQFPPNDVSLNVELNITMVRQVDQIKNRFFVNKTTGSESSKMTISRSFIFVYVPWPIETF